MNGAHDRRQRTRPGYSLIELLVAMTVTGILLALAMPTFADWLRAYRQLNQAQALARTLDLARSEAVKRNGRVNVCKTADRRDCTRHGGWESGWLLFADGDDDGQVGDSIIVDAEPPAPAGITIVGNVPIADYVSYTSLGMARTRSGALQMGTFTVCAKGQTALHVVLAETGRVRIQRMAVRCA
jgi:type IV fimbrial biogenesis protein FimT